MLRPTPFRHQFDHRPIGVQELMTSSKRNDEGLTPRMVEVLPVIASFPLKTQGLRELARIGKPVDRHHFFNVWMRDENFIKAYNAAREKHEGSVREQTENLMVSYETEVVLNVVKTAISSRADSMRAAEMFLNMRGYDTGKGNRLSVHNIQSIGSKQEGFADRIRNRVVARFGADIFDAADGDAGGDDAG